MELMERFLRAETEARIIVSSITLFCFGDKVLMIMTSPRWHETTSRNFSWSSCFYSLYMYMYRPTSLSAMIVLVHGAEGQTDQRKTYVMDEPKCGSLPSEVALSLRLHVSPFYLITNFLTHVFSQRPIYLYRPTHSFKPNLWALYTLKHHPNNCLLPPPSPTSCFAVHLNFRHYTECSLTVYKLSFYSDIFT